MVVKLSGSSEALRSAVSHSQVATRRGGLCALCAEHPAEVRVSWLDKAEPLAGAVAQYKLCSECSEAADAARLLSLCDKHSSLAQHRASRPAAEQLSLML
jgi:hypothetical protein